MLFAIARDGVSRRRDHAWASGTDSGDRAAVEKAIAEREAGRLRGGKEKAFNAVGRGDEGNAGKGSAQENDPGGSRPPHLSARRLGIFQREPALAVRSYGLGSLLVYHE